MVETSTVITAIALFSIPSAAIALLTFMQGRQIHDLVNSNLDRVKKELQAAHGRIYEMQGTINRLIEQLKDAHAAPVASTVASPVPVVETVPVERIALKAIEAIEANTEAIKHNTTPEAKKDG